MYRRGRDEEHAELMGVIEACAPGSMAAGKAASRIPEPSAEQKAYIAKLEKAGAMMSDPALAKYDLDTRARITIAAGRPGLRSCPLSFRPR